MTFAVTFMNHPPLSTVNCVFERSNIVVGEPEDNE
jgi:hypothetical protein